VTRKKLEHQPRPLARLAHQLPAAIADLERFGPILKNEFIARHSSLVLERLLASRDLKQRETHVGWVVTLNQYKHKEDYGSRRSTAGLNRSVILRAALERLVSEGYAILERSSASAILERASEQTLLLAHLRPQTVATLQVIVALPQKRKRGYRIVHRARIQILEVGASLAPIDHH
jgi:hypothetical protein